MSASAKKAKKTKEPEAPVLYEDPPDKLTSKDGRDANLKITSWNVDGLRAWVKKKGLDVSLLRNKPFKQTYCEQETKCFYHYYSSVGARGSPRCFVSSGNKVLRKSSSC